MIMQLKKAKINSKNEYVYQTLKIKNMRNEMKCELEMKSSK